MYHRKKSVFTKAFIDDKISRQCHHCKNFDIRVFVLHPLLFFSRGGITQASGSERKTDAADFQDWMYYQKFVTWRKSARLLKASAQYLKTKMIYVCFIIASWKAYLYYKQVHLVFGCFNIQQPGIVIGNWLSLLTGKLHSSCNIICIDNSK